MDLKNMLEFRVYKLEVATECAEDIGTGQSSGAS